MSSIDVALRPIPLTVLQSIVAGEPVRGLELPALHERFLNRGHESAWGLGARRSATLPQD